MTTILIGGYYGAGNVGDEAILEATLADLRGARPGLEFCVVSWDPEHTRRQYQVRAVHWRNIRDMVDAAQDADLILVGGGGLFQDHWGLDPASYLRVDHGGISTYGSLPLLARLAGIPCMLYGVGIGPLESELAREHTRMAAERCQRVTVRDRHSSQLLVDAGYPADASPLGEVMVTADPAFGLSTSPVSEKAADRLLEEHDIPSGAHLLAVNLRYWDRPHPPQDWLPGIAAGVGEFLGAHPAVEMLLIPFQHSADSAYTDDFSPLRRLSRALPDGRRVHVLQKVPSPAVCQSLIGRCELMLGMRLHSLIMGTKMCTPIVGLPYDPKVTSLMKEMRLEEYCLPTYAPSPEALNAILSKAWERRDALREGLSEISAEMETRSQENARQALALLDTPFEPRGAGWRRFTLGWIKLRERFDRWRGRLPEEGA